MPRTATSKSGDETAASGAKGSGAKPSRVAADGAKATSAKATRTKAAKTKASEVEATEVEATEVEATEVEATEAKVTGVGPAAEAPPDEGEESMVEVPLNRAERRARKKGGPKPDALGKVPPAGRQNLRRESGSHAPRQWANRRSG